MFNTAYVGIVDTTTKLVAGAVVVDADQHGLAFVADLYHLGLVVLGLCKGWSHGRRVLVLQRRLLGWWEGVLRRPTGRLLGIRQRV